jgi:hypothetical protein
MAVGRAGTAMGVAWRNAKHRAQWRMTLLGEMPPDADGNAKRTRHDYCAAIRNKPVSTLTTEDALRVLKAGVADAAGDGSTDCGGGASASRTSPGPVAMLPAKTRSAGAAISTSCCQGGRY